MFYPIFSASLLLFLIYVYATLNSEEFLRVIGSGIGFVTVTVPLILDAIGPFETTTKNQITTTISQTDD